MIMYIDIIFYSRILDDAPGGVLRGRRPGEEDERRAFVIQGKAAAVVAVVQVAFVIAL